MTSTTYLVAIAAMFLIAGTVAVTAWLHERRARMWLGLANEIEQRMQSDTRDAHELSVFHCAIENSQRRAREEAYAARCLWLVIGIHRSIDIHRSIPDYPTERP